MGEVEEEEQPSRHDMPAFPSGKAEGEGRSQRRQHAPVREPDGPGPVEAPLRGAAASSWAAAKSAHCPARANKSSRLI